jgi:hypothetical protein
VEKIVSKQKRVDRVSDNITRHLVISWSNSKIKIFKKAFGSGIVWKTFRLRRNYLTNISHKWQIFVKESLIELDHHQKESSDTVQKTQDRRPVDIEVSGSCEFWYIS